LGRPRQSQNSAPRKFTVARYERERRGLSLSMVSRVTTIPLGSLSEIERGTMVPRDKDLEALAKLYGYEESSVLLLEFAIVPKLDEAHA
jgi:transcriptional regulator with XRE-family HTH domain